jgi:hypothetical protein
VERFSEIGWLQKEGCLKVLDASGKAEPMGHARSLSELTQMPRDRDARAAKARKAFSGSDRMTAQVILSVIQKSV